MKAKSKRTVSIGTAPHHLHFRFGVLRCYFVLAIAVYFVRGEDLPCPTGWVTFGNGDCFLVSEHLTTWLSARAFCLEQGGDLVALGNPSEDALLGEYINASSGQVEGFWLGLNDINLPGIFEWSDTSPITYTKWSQEEPNWNADNATGNCVSLNHEMQWVIQNCTSEFGLICRMRNARRAAVLKQVPRCDPGMHSFRNSCYWSVSGDSWQSADQWCKSEGGHLVTIGDSLENIYVYTMLVHQEHKLHWLGLDVSKDTQRLTWVNGEDVQYSNWNFPPEFTPELCGVMVRFGKWMLQTCNFQYAGGICEKPTTPSVPITPATITLSLPEECPEGWTFLNDYCYLVQINQLFTWEQSRNECLSLGGDLAHFVTKDEEITAVTSLLTPSDEDKPHALFDALTATSLSQSVWIGLTLRVLSSPGSWPVTTTVALVWTDGTSPTYHNWQTGPNTTQSNQCIQLPLNVLRPQWKEKPCSAKAGYVCKMATQSRGTAVRDCSVVPCVSPTSPSEPDGVPPPPTPSTAPPTSAPTTTATTTTTKTMASLGQCPMLWDAYGTKCFILIDNPTEWLTAQAICQNYGPNHDLPSIHDPGEQAFFTSLMEKHHIPEAWLGLNDLTTEGLQWSDGTPLDFTHWSREDVPDQNRNPAQQRDKICAVTSTLAGESDVWGGRPCNEINNFYCQLTLENEGGVAEMPGRPPDEEWIPPPIEAVEATKAATTSTTTIANPWPPSMQATDNENEQSNSNNGQPNTAKPHTSDVAVQEPEVPVLSDLPASQSAILDGFMQPLPTSTVEPWFMDESSQDMAMTKSHHQVDYRPLTNGTIAGIVLGCLLGSGLITAGLIYLYHNYLANSVIRREKLSFDNALYNPSGDQIQLNTNEVTSTTPA